MSLKFLHLNVKYNQNKTAYLLYCQVYLIYSLLTVLFSHKKLVKMDFLLKVLDLKLYLYLFVCFMNRSIQFYEEFKNSLNILRTLFLIYLLINIKHQEI